MAELINVKELADARGWTHQKVRRTLDRAGVKIVRGMVDQARAEAALSAKGEVATAEEKRYLECELLRIQRDKANGDLVEVDEIVEWITRRDGEIATRLNVWRDNLIAKHSDQWRLFEQAFAELQAMIAEPVGRPPQSK